MPKGIVDSRVAYCGSQKEEVANEEDVKDIPEDKRSKVISGNVSVVSVKVGVVKEKDAARKTVSINPMTDDYLEETARSLGKSKSDVILEAVEKGKQRFKSLFAEDRRRQVLRPRRIHVDKQVFCGEEISVAKFEDGSIVPSGTIIMSNELMRQKHFSDEERRLTVGGFFGRKRKAKATMSSKGDWTEEGESESSDVHAVFKDGEWQYEKGGG